MQQAIHTPLFWLSQELQDLGTYGGRCKLAYRCILYTSSIVHGLANSPLDIYDEHHTVVLSVEAVALQCRALVVRVMTTALEDAQSEDSES